MTDDRLVHLEVATGVATVTLDSPHNRNALSSALVQQLLEALASAASDDTVRVVVLSHTGPAFCSGADLKETATSFTTAPGAAAVPAARMGEVITAIWESPKPVVARVGGPARAGGLGLIAAADIAVCDEAATFAFSEVRLGVVPAVISSTVLRRLTPRGAAELYLTGDSFGGLRAAEVGLVTVAVPGVDLDATVHGYTQSLLRGAPGALAAAKTLSRRQPGADVRDELGFLTQLSVDFFTSPEGREGVTAFAEKREPSWVPHP